MKQKSKEMPAKTRRRLGDRKEGRRLRTLPANNLMGPYFMKGRAESQNTFEDTIELTAIEAFLKRKHEEGYPHMGVLHLFIASYVRAIAQRPAINRFIAGQRIYARRNIEGIMTVKKEMSLDSPETTVKVTFDPADSVEDVYRKFNSAVEAASSTHTDFDRTAKALARIPRFLMRTAIGFLRLLDYFGWVPQSLLDVSPFHGSFAITSMGSLGINAIYHHLYEFGTVPVFMSYGKRYSVNVLNDDGTVKKKHYVSFRVTTEDRICDGYDYASAFKIIKRQLLRPELLEGRYETVREDID
ncbi:MAG: hypothetical protein WDA00_00445 [Eubacteriales bacterium]